MFYSIETANFGCSVGSAKTTYSTREASAVVVTGQVPVQTAPVVQMVMSDKTGAMVIASGMEKNVWVMREEVNTQKQKY